MVEPMFMKNFWWTLFYIAIALGGMGIAFGILNYYKRRTERKMRLINPEDAEIKVYHQVAEVNLTLRWVVLTLQVLVFVAGPILLILRTGMAYEYFIPTRQRWLGATLLYTAIVDGGGLGVWVILSMQLTMSHDAFETILKRKDGSVSWHQWFTGSERPLTRGQVSVYDIDAEGKEDKKKPMIDNPTIKNALEKYENKLADSTEFKIGGQPFWITFCLAYNFDYDACAIVTRHPWGEAWIRQQKQIYARNLPMKGRVSMAKFREYGMLTITMERKGGDIEGAAEDGTLEQRQFKIQQVPLLYAVSDDRDDVDAFREFSVSIGDLTAEEFIAAQVGGVTPSVFGLLKRLNHTIAETNRQIQAAHLREKTRNESNDAMAKLHGVKGTTARRNKTDWTAIIMSLMIGLLIGTFVLSRLVMLPIVKTSLLM